MPLILLGTSDARFFSLLGIQTYGFTAMKLPTDLGLMQSAHEVGERMPAEAVDFDANAVHGLIRSYEW